PDGNVYVAGASGQRLFRYSTRTSQFTLVGPIVWGDFQVHFTSQLQFINDGRLIGAERFCCAANCSAPPIGAGFSIDPSLGAGAGLREGGPQNILNGISALAVSQTSDAVVITDDPGRIVRVTLFTELQSDVWHPPPAVPWQQVSGHSDVIF